MRFNTILIKKINLRVFSCILLALIICSNAIRFLFNIYESNLVIYSFYILFIVINMLQERLLYSTIKRRVMPLVMVSLLIIGYSLATGLYYGNNAIYSAFKLIISILIAYYVIKMPLCAVKLSLRYTFLICIIYSLMLVISPNGRNQYLMGGGNYLNMTLPIGLVLSIFFSRTICSFYFKKSLRYQILCICISIFLFLTVMIFPARGSILFPFVVAIFIAIFLGQKNFLKFVGILLSLALVVFAASQYFLNTASGYNLHHMLNLFQDIRSEDRFIIWKQYINYIITHKWFLIGGGTNASITKLGFYPHNLYLQFIGEFGIIGIIFSAVITAEIIKDAIIAFNTILKTPNLKNGIIELYFDCISGLLYLFLTFMKSFSIYDACIFMIFGAMAINVCQACYNNAGRYGEEVLNGRDIIKCCNSNKK